MDEKKIDFEKNIAELEKISASLESGEISLDESLALFEKGVKIIKECNSALDEAEQKVNVLISGKDGEIKEEAFGEE
jgi:exodeoxyribonuclease VII small subunit